MNERFKLATNATKKVILDKYDELLNAYIAKAAELEERQKQQSAGQKHSDRQALETTRDATVDGIVGGIASLRSKIAHALNDVSESLGKEAERLVNLQRAVELREKRLQELHEIEVAADTMKQLAAVYVEQRREAESTYAARVEALEKDFEERKVGLESKARQARDSWESDQRERDLSRSREQAEYEYERDRTRKLEAHAFEEKRALAEKQLAESLSAAETDLAGRTEAIAAREAIMKDLEQQVASFPDRLRQEVEAATSAVAASLNKEAEQKAQLAAMEHKWEKKILDQQIKHLTQSLEDADKKIEILREAEKQALARVNEIATKAIEGASSQTAFKSVNQIALEQARGQDAVKVKA